MTFRSTVILIFCLFGFASCWTPCAPGIYGKVIDDVTEEPVDSVEIKFYEEGEYVQTVYSDSAGTISLNTDSESVFLTSKCERHFSLLLIKDGYDSLEYKDVAPKVDFAIRLKK